MIGKTFSYQLDVYAFSKIFLYFDILKRSTTLNWGPLSFLWTYYKYPPSHQPVSLWLFYDMCCCCCYCVYMCVCACMWCMCVCVYVCVCVCVCVCVTPFTVKASSVWISWTTREQINDVVLKTFISYVMSLYLYFRMKHLTFLTGHFILITY